jgi:glc operon protein GlcG
VAELNLAASRKICDAATSFAEEHNLRLSVAVIDSGCRLKQLCRMDGARFITADIAVGKAFASVAFEIPSGAAAERLGGMPGPSADGIMTVTGQHMVPIRGALPCWDGDRLLGAVGVSGATSEQDEMAARAGLQAAGLQEARAGTS